MRVAVILVNWNGLHHLRTCLPALAAQRHADREIVVVDNGSTDGSVEWILRKWPRVRLIQSGANVGFAAANNAAIRSSDADWVALINNDAVPDPDWLSALAEIALSDERLGSVASLMLFEDDPATINSAGIALDTAGIAWDRLGGAPVSEGGDEAEVFGASAGAALYRRSALVDVAEIGSAGRPEYFDERFFMYFEDVDLAWRLRLRGWKSRYAPGARALHRGSASAGEGTPFKNRLLARNKVWTVLKDYPGWPLVRHSPLVLAYDLASAPYRLLFQGQTAALRGRLDALSGIRETMRRRRRVQARRTADWFELVSTMTPLESPLAVLRRYRHLSDRAAGPK